ncbi:MAG TPA: GNAT family N-acetyltransferase [Gemmatimonadales bacterium]|jgi:GNAT superfamily N-acetyltransferase|nr:GNAT family N-acetyltransferase [Gemmatimonadales bacterium]
MVQDDRQLTIREMESGEEFGDWLRELAEDTDAGAADEGPEERHLVLTDEIGDWIGGLRWSLRGGVASVIEVGILPRERHQGHAHRLLAAFELRAAEQGAHVLELWTDHPGEEGFLEALGWQCMLSRESYVGGRTWYLLEKRVARDD